MQRMIDWAATLAVPVAYRQDPAKRQDAQDIRQLSLVVVTAMALVGLAFLALAIAEGPDWTSLAFLAAWLGGTATLWMIRATGAITLALCVGGAMTASIWGAAAWGSGALSSPFLPALLVLPTLALALPQKAPFWVTAITSLIAIAALAWQSWAGVTAQTDISDMSRIILALFAAAILWLGASAALGTHRKLRAQVDLAHDDLSTKTAEITTLSNKMAKYLAPQAYASVFSGAEDVQLGASRKKLTVYFADIVDFTDATDTLEPEDLATLLNDYFTNMAELVAKHGGTIDKYIGDAIMVFFGDPDTLGPAEDAVACVEMALEMQARIDLLRDKWLAMGVSRPLQMRAGINTGYCTIGNFGSENRMDYTIIGAQVNIAARLEQAAQPGSVLISQQTHALVRDHFECSEMGSVQVKGIREPVKAYQLGRRASSTAKEALIHEKLDGLSLVIDPNALTPKDRNTARRYLERALDRLKD